MKKSNSVSLLLRFLAEITRQRKLLVLTLIAIIGSTITTLLAPYILRVAIDFYILPGKYTELSLVVLLYFAVLAGQWGFQTLRSATIVIYGQKILYDMRNNMFNKLLSVKISCYKDRQIGDLVSRIINDTSTLNEVLVSGLLSTIGDILSLIGILVVMIMLSPSLTLVSLVSIPLMVFTAKYFGGRLRTAYKETRERVAKLSSIVNESIAGIEVIKSFGQENRVLNEFEDASINTLKSYMRIAIVMGVFWPLMNLSSTLSIVAVLLYGGYLVINGVLSIGVLIAFVQYVNRFTQPINGLVSMYDSLQSALAALERIYEVIDTGDVEHDEGAIVEKLRGEIVFKNVWFEYEPGKPVLKNINLVIKPGELVAIVGHTGAGKTTFANLLVRLYEPTHGEILVDGRDIRSYKLSFIRSRISYVPQETYLFPGTIVDNIRIGKPEASEQEVIEVCKKLGIHEFIEKLPQGYYTDAGEAGKRLSLGEKQLIAIARAMLRDPDIVILDEALSSVDPATEEIVKNAIKALMKGRTGIIIAHRLSITRDCDRVVVLENGEIVEEGKPDQLLKRRGRFYELYNLQLLGQKSSVMPV
ncbi:MAG: ABC transporter ATP-binding protein [Thermoprotei archaeon]